jgi:hypothetical protein
VRKRRGTVQGRRLLRLLKEQELVRLQLTVDNYVGVFRRRDKAGRWRKFWQVGNGGMALEIADLLKLLGHVVDIIDLPDKEES